LLEMEMLGEGVGGLMLVGACAIGVTDGLGIAQRAFGGCEGCSLGGAWIDKVSGATMMRDISHETFLGGGEHHADGTGLWD
jgi:hypothetical protein